MLNDNIDIEKLNNIVRTQENRSSLFERWLPVLMMKYENISNLAGEGLCPSVDLVLLS